MFYAIAHGFHDGPYNPSVSNNQIKSFAFCPQLSTWLPNIIENFQLLIYWNVFASRWKLESESEMEIGKC